jgi:hypothetical protein
LRPDGIDGGNRLALPVLIRVDENASALGLRPLGGDEPAMISANSRVCAYVCRLAIGTSTWNPSTVPLVFG